MNLLGVYCWRNYCIEVVAVAVCYFVETNVVDCCCCCTDFGECCWHWSVGAFVVVVGLKIAWSWSLKCYLINSQNVGWVLVLMIHLSHQPILLLDSNWNYSCISSYLILVASAICLYKVWLLNCLKLCRPTYYLIIRLKIALVLHRKKTSSRIWIRAAIA